MNDWLTDIFNYSEGGKTAVCAVCKQRKAVNPDSLLDICNKCDTGIGDVITYKEWKERLMRT